jgi:hypothetical protein
VTSETVRRTEKAKTVDFGAADRFGAYVFRVEIPEARNAPVVIVEHYGYEGGERGIPVEEERVRLGRTVWSGIAEAARHDFNQRLRERKIPTSRWKTGPNLVDRLLGKELCVLAWAAERARPEELPVICSRWSALRPEERWWLFAMTVAEAGLPEDGERGWRRALYDALSDGITGDRPKRRRRPVDETGLPVLPLFDVEP